MFCCSSTPVYFVSNKYQIYTVLLREAYNGPELVHKDPLVIVKNKFGELMQEGLHEYNQRRCLVNLEKKRKGMNLVKSERKKDGSAKMSDQDDSVCKRENDFIKDEEKLQTSNEQSLGKVTPAASAVKKLITPGAGAANLIIPNKVSESDSVQSCSIPYSELLQLSTP
ncbi:hypothetical protein CRYUN_Cryun28dG0025900 [Craigia yunnanensis]